MTDPALSPLAQVEWTLDDLAAASETLGALFGAEPIEEAFSAALAGPHMDIVHLGLGQVVLQLCRPRVEGLGHARALERCGPHVYNLTWFVDDLSAVRARILRAGLTLEWDFPLREIYERVIPPDNLSGSFEALMAEAQQRVGFNLELAETPWATEPEPRLVYPAYHPDWATGAGSTGPLQVINIVTHDAAGAVSTLNAVFGNSLEVSAAPHPSEAGGLLEAEVELGRVRLRYLQPLVDSRSGLNVSSRGAAVHSLALRVPDLEFLAAAASARGLRMAECPPMLFGSSGETHEATWSLDLRGLLGIELIVRGAEPATD